MKRIRFALRTLVRTPGLTAVVVISLGLGIGANTAIFSLLNQMVLESLPVAQPEQLAILQSPAEFKDGRSSSDNSGNQDFIFSYRMFRELERHAPGVAGLAGFRRFGANLAFRNQTVAGSLMLVSGGYFPVLGVKPLMGRTIEPDDDRHGAGNPVAVLSYGYWKDRLGAQTDVLNQTIRVNGQAFTIVGVAPRMFTSTVLGMEPDIYLPMCFKARLTPGWDGTDKWDDYWIYAFVRLKPGTTRMQAADALNVVYGGLVQEQAKVVHSRDPEQDRRFLKSRLTLKDGRQGQSSLRDDSRTPILILMIATVLVLLIAIANAANLLLARSAQRRRELAIRIALGAGRGNIVRQLLTEALLLALGGGAAGLVLGSWTVHLLVARISGGDSPVYSLSARLEPRVLLFTLGVSLLTGLLFGLYPAWEAARGAVVSSLKDASTQTSAGKGTARVRKALVCAQVMISALLLIPTGLFLKSLVNLLHVDLGIRTENLITFAISPSLNSYKAAQTRALFERAESELAAIPGVPSVTSATVPLIGGSNWGNTLIVEGYSRDPHADTNSMFDEVGPGFFGRMGIPLIAGREFTEADTLAAPRVAVVNQTFAKHFFADRNPIGRKFGPGFRKEPDIEIVGVIKDAHYAGVKQKVPRVYYTPWRQDQDPNGISFYVRSALPPGRVIPQIRRVMASLDRDLPLENLRTMDDQIRRNIRSDRIVLQLAAAFAILATILASLGLYGVMAYSVTRRTREIGIRLAVGAGPARIRAMIVRELLLILAVGLAVGIPGALGLARLARSQLYGVSAYDATVVAGAILALTLAAITAAAIPLRRAMRINPLEALRYE